MPPFNREECRGLGWGWIRRPQSQSYSSSFLRTSVCVGTFSPPPSQGSSKPEMGYLSINKPQGPAPLNLCVFGGVTYLL